MNLVVDTHALVWHLSGQQRRLGRRARRALREAEEGRWTVRIPAPVLMELVLLEERGRLRFSYRELRDQLALRPGLPVEPLTADDIEEARGLSGLPDPFDRLIAGTALRLGLPLITADSLLTAVGRLPIYW